MKLTVLGCNGAVPRAGGACSGYLLAQGDQRLLFDCGSGVFARLRQHVDPASIAVVISHFHADHFFDLVPYRYYLYYLANKPGDPVKLFLPPGGRAWLDVFVEGSGLKEGFFSETFDIVEYRAGQRFAIGGLTVEPREVKHYITSHGFRVSGDATFVYSGDTAFDSSVVDLARGADLFLCETSAQESTYAETREGHLSAADGARIATAAGAKHLLLTHIWHALEPQVSIAEACGLFDGELGFAEEGKEYLLS